MQFEMRHMLLDGKTPALFSEQDGPDWLTSKNTIVGSTMDMRWFWRDHVLTLDVGASVNTEFQKIIRIA